MKYYRGWITTPIENYLPASTPKALAFTVAGGYTTANDTTTWIPRSQVKVGEPNEFGNAEILVPLWILKQKGIEPQRIREIEGYNGENDIVER